MKKIKEKLSEIHILLFLKLIPYMFREYWIFTAQLQISVAYFCSIGLYFLV